MDKIIRDIDIITEAIKRVRFAEVALKRFNPLGKGLFARAPGERHHIVACVVQGTNQSPSNESGRTHNEHTHVFVPWVGTPGRCGDSRAVLSMSGTTERDTWSIQWVAKSGRRSLTSGDGRPRFAGRC